MSVAHKEHSVKNLRLKNSGIEPPADWSNVAEVRRVVRAQVGAACTAAIYAGVEVGGKRYSLTSYDQTEILAQLQAVRGGAESVPYHADGELCRIFPAAEFMDVANAAMQYIFYHRTYCNHINAWIERAALEELEGMAYGVDLPGDLAESMEAILGAASESAE
jgi:hypothetical protein